MGMRAIIPCPSTLNEKFHNNSLCNTILNVTCQHYPLLPVTLYDLLTRCVTAPVFVDSQVKKLMSSNFLSRIFTFTGNVKTEKLINL